MFSLCVILMMTEMMMITFRHADDKDEVIKGRKRKVCLFVGWLLNVPATC